ncbi:MAG: glycosyltransferase family 2 protein [Fibrobacteria bacterium]
MLEKKLPLVSITVPSYNQGRFIKETMDSILSQDYASIEILVMDGGSKDDTLEVLGRYAGDSRIKVKSERDKGQADAINKGFAESKGDIIAWLNSDDTYLPGVLAKQVGFLLANPEIDLVYGDAVYTKVDGTRCGTYFARPFSHSELCRLCFIPQPSVFMRRQVYERNGPLDLSLHFALDYEYWLRAMFHSRFAYNPGFVATYRLHEESKTVGGATNFNPEVERAVVRALNDQAAPDALKKDRENLLADLYLGLGNSCLRAANRKDAKANLRKSISHRTFRPRLFWFISYYLLGVPATNALAQQWTRWRSRRGHMELGAADIR